MNTSNLRERYFKGKVYTSLSPVIFLTALVWFTPDLLAIKVAHSFQVYLSLLLFFSSSYLWSQSRIKTSILSRNQALGLATIFLFSAPLGGVLTFFLNPVYGLSLILTIMLGLFFFRVPNQTETKFPYWFKELILKSNIMLCICLIVMLAYWLNPYTVPLNYFLK